MQVCNFLKQKSLFRSICHNQVLGYALSRYLMSGISFITSMIVAVKLGSYLLGIYGFFMLLRNYFKISNLGIPDSTTILMIQNKDSEASIACYEKNAIILTALLSFLIALFGLSHYLFDFQFISKYDLSWEFYILCVIAIITLFNDLFFKIYRVEGRIAELTFYQSIIQILCFICALLLEGRVLVTSLILSYLLGNVSSAFLFIFRGYIHFEGAVSIGHLKEIFTKGIYLFLYNFLFYLIFISTRTAVSIWYDVSEFGMFTFAYTLSHGVILLIDAIAALLIPKLIDRFNTDDTEVIENTIQLLKINYTYTAYGLTWLLIIAFTILLYFMKDYYDAFEIVMYMSLTVVLQTHSFPYSTLLMAKNKERLVAFCSAVALFVNLLLVWLFIKTLNLNYQYLILGTWISYYLYTLMCIYYARQTISKKSNIFLVLRECVQFAIMLPVLAGMLVAIAEARYLVLIPFVIYIVMNYRIFSTQMNSLLKIVKNPKIIDVKK